MAVTEKDLIMIPLTEEMQTLVSYWANKRLLYEYPRKGYGDYDTRGTSAIETGVLGELGFLEFIQTYLQEKTKGISAPKRWKKLQKVQFSYRPIIGSFDEGFEFIMAGKSIDIKTYENNKVTVNQIFRGLKGNGRALNLMIDQTQSHSADIYVQSFLTKDNHICLAGFYKGLPKEIGTWMPQPAHYCPIPQLNPMKDLLTLLKI
jgi:hypothetical protein